MAEMLRKQTNNGPEVKFRLWTCRPDLRIRRLGFMLRVRVRVRVSIRVKIKVRVSKSIVPYCRFAVLMCILPVTPKISPIFLSFKTLRHQPNFSCV